MIMGLLGEFRLSINALGFLSKAKALIEGKNMTKNMI